MILSTLPIGFQYTSEMFAAVKHNINEFHVNNLYLIAMK
jgi:hypothetical protein